MNTISRLRKEKGLTQAALAKLAGTSQQQIQRYESGQAPRLDVALRVCAALGASLGEVFPSLKNQRKLNALVKKPAELLADDKARAALHEAGIDTDPEFHFLKLRLTSGVERVYQITGVERRRLWSLFQTADANEEHTEFVVFDTHEARVAVNARSIAFVHFLFEAFPPNDEAHGDARFAVYFGERPEPLELDMEPDDEEPEDEEEDDEGQIRGAFFLLELGVSSNDSIILRDVDGESVMIRSSKIALLEAPLWLLGGDDYSSDDSATTT